MKIPLLLSFLIQLACVLCSAASKSPFKRCLAASNLTSPEFIDNIFTKYGSTGADNFRVLSSDRFGDLIENLGIGRVRTVPKDTPLQTTRVPSKKIKRSLKRGKRSGDNTKKCLKWKKILSVNSISENTIITKDEFFRVCPTLIQQIDNKICVHHAENNKDDDDHNEHGDEHDDHADGDDDDDKHDDDDDDHDDHEGEDHDEDHGGHSHGTSSATEVWGYGFASITIISALCLSVIGIIPCLQKTFYTKVMSFLVALAVGTLTGDALLHLIPHAFLEGSNEAARIKIKGSLEIEQHYALVHRALFALAGMYAFFIVEQIMTMTKGGHGHSHGGHEAHDTDYNRSESKKGLIRDGSTNNGNADITDGEFRGREESVTTEMNAAENGKLPTVTYDDSRKEDSNKTSELTITSVAWMVMVGDGFHNFSDGLAVGAAFSSSVASGLSTSIAIFCHELPHELGDFAILIRNGMTVKQALIYNITSAFLAYLGLIVGILAGEYSFGRHLILSITAGLFLYVSLVDMLPELMRAPKHSRVSTFICQHLGLLSGVGIMLIISIYEHSM